MVNFFSGCIHFCAVVAMAAAINPLYEDNIGPKKLQHLAPPSPSAFRFASSQGNDMVLQSAPLQANIWGFCPTGATVSVMFNGQTLPTTNKMWLNQSTWSVQLPATPSGFKQYNISATSAGSKTITLSNVLFGDVWVCSGQSNMQYPLGQPNCWNPNNTDCHIKDAQCGYGCVQNSAAEIAAMSNWTNMRVYTNMGPNSKVPIAESANSGWMQPAKMGGSFSAMCWFFGRDLYHALDTAGTARPIGLIETNVGGTPDQHWSSPDALNKCKNLNEPWEWPANYTDSVLWNGKVVPLLRNTIKGAVWMQGEANARTDGRQYNCSFPAMITDWREKWAEGTDGATEAAFPFGWSQLNSDGGATVWTPNTTQPQRSGVDDVLGQWNTGFPSIRNAESHTLSLPNSFQAVIIDTPVASGSVHSPYKQPAGDRLTRQALDVAYAMPQPSPVFGSAKQSANGDIVVKIVGAANAALEARAKYGFEVLEGKMWNSYSFEIDASNSVVVHAKPNAIALRYLWQSAPCGNAAPYLCPVYVKVPALGSLSGQFDFLPLGPFITEF